jgi:pyridoxal phosphate enzyme (YggS family)
VTATAATVAERVVAVRARIRAAGGEHVQLVAVTKGFGSDAIAAARDAGVDAIGENYAQELLAKLDELTGPRPQVHFIGRVQSRKVRALAGTVDLWQSIDRASLVDELTRRRPDARLLVQVNVSDEPGKGGCEPATTAALVERARAAGLTVEGLMAVGRMGPPALARPGFALLRRLVDDLGLRECSMGMTDDLEVAVQEGSTMVRVGTALFGLRPRHSEVAK